MESIKGTALLLVKGRVVEGEETFTAVMKALKAEFGEKVQAAATKHVLDFQGWKRPKQMKLREFLSGHVTKKALALKHGTQMCPVTSGALLLDAANLGVNVRREIMGTIKNRSGKGASAELPQYTMVLDELEELAVQHEIADQKTTVCRRQGRRQRRKARRQRKARRP